MEKPRFRVKAEKYGWVFFAQGKKSYKYVGTTSYKYGLTSYCKSYLNRNKHLK